MKFGKIKDLLPPYHKKLNFFKIRQELTELWPFKSWYFFITQAESNEVFWGTLF